MGKADERARTEDAKGVEEERIRKKACRLPMIHTNDTDKKRTADRSRPPQRTQRTAKENNPKKADDADKSGVIVAEKSEMWRPNETAC